MGNARAEAEGREMLGVFGALDRDKMLVERSSGRSPNRGDPPPGKDIAAL